jgi:hypothetical protein
MADARFEDAAAHPLRLKAETADDLPVIAAVLQDAVGRVADAAWLPRRHRFALVLNRYRWEAKAPERVRCGLMVEHVRRVRALGVGPADKARVWSVLDLAFEAGPDGAGTLRLVLAGGAALALDVEALDVKLDDLSRPWPAAAVPRHGD